MKIEIRNYRPSDRSSVAAVHDEARMDELAFAGLEGAFLPFERTADNEGFFEYPNIFVALLNDEVAGFAACSDDELAWLYVSNKFRRLGVGSALVLHCLKACPQIENIEVLEGNYPARRLYEKFGFKSTGVVEGKMPGNEAFGVKVRTLKRFLGR